MIPVSSTLQKPRRALEETGEFVDDSSRTPQNPANTMIFSQRNPQESPGIPWNPQKFFEIIRHPQESK